MSSEKLPKGYKQTEVGVIPDDWEVKPFFEVLKIASGQVNPKREPFKSMVLVAPDHIEGVTGRLLKCSTAAEQNAISGKYLFKPDDIVYSKIRPYLRKAIHAGFEGLCSADMYPLTPKEGNDASFLFSLILGEPFSRYAETVSARSGIPKINREELSQCKLAIPPTKTEQEAIATTLSDTDALIEALEKAIAKKRHIKQGTMQELLTGKRRLPGFGEGKGYKQTEIGVIPEDWKVVTADQICELVVDCKNRTPPVVEGGDFAVVRTPNVRHGKFVQEDLRFTDKYSFVEWTARAVPQIGDILITREAPLGEVCLVPENLQVCLGQRMMLYRPDFKKLDSSFLLYMLMAPAVQNCLQKKIGGSTVGHAKVDDIRNLAVPIPPTKVEQEAIATILSDMDTEIATLETKLTKTRQLKQGMMHNLLTGRIRLI